MNYQFTFLSLVFFIAAAIGLFVASVAWHRKKILSARYLILLELAVAEWAFMAAIEAAATTIPLKLFWSQLSYLGITGAVVSYFFLALVYGQYRRHLTRRNIVLILIIPFLTILIVATNNWHHWYYTNISINPNNNIAIYTHGFWFWIYTTYAYILLAIGLIILLKAIFRLPSIYKDKIILLIIGAILPFIGNVMYVFNLNPIPGLDWTPLAFGISGLILVWGVYRYRLLDLIPVARHKLVETMVDGVMVIDIQDRIVDLNPAMETIIGVPADKALGQEATEVLTNWKELLYCLQDGKDTQTEIQLVKDNLVLFYDLLISTIFDKRNLISGHLILLRNITKYKFAENALRVSENEFRELFQNMRSGVAVYQSVDEGRDFVFKRLNVAAEHLTQIKSKDVIGKRVTTVFPGIKEFGLLEVFKRVWRTGKPAHHPTSLYKDERISSWFENYVYKLQSEEIVAVFDDITDRKHNEVLQHVIFQIAEAATTVSAMDELYQTIHQLLGKIINVNNFYIALYDHEKQLLSFPFCKDEVDIYPKPKALGRGLTEYMIHTGKSLFLPKTELFKLVEDGEIELIGTPAELYLGTPLKIKTRIIGVLAVQSYSANDVYSEKDLRVLEYVSGQIAAVIIHKQAEEIIRKSEEKHRLLSEELGKANSMKELLLDVISHDLKNPAGIIRGFAEIAVEEDPDNDILKYLYTSSNNLLKVIDNAAILSKVGVGDEIDKEELDLIELIEIVVGEFSNPLDELNIDLEINSVKPLTITANPIISEVFRNYISNAIKYAGTGKKILIDVKQNRDYLIAEVTDFGKTVPKRDYKRIFTRKYQLEHGQGRGLGLAIVKRIAEAHNAEVGVRPNQPTGNIFFLKIRQK